MNGKHLELVEEPDLQALVDDKVREGKQLDYKEHVGSRDEDKKEFLKDVSSLANASGGDLLIGVREEPPGVAGELVGTAAVGADAEIQRFENLLRDGIEPRIPGVAMRAVPIGDRSKAVIIIRVPRSLVQPHVVSFRGHWRFYSRNSAGGYPLDVPEVRAAFSLSEATAGRLRSFRAERLAAIVAGETPVSLAEGATVVLHVVPLGALDPVHRFDSSTLRQALGGLEPLRGGATTQRHNFDGLVVYHRSDEGTSRSYVQLFRSGAVEAVDTAILQPWEGRNIIPSGALEQGLVDGLQAYVEYQSALGIEPPIFVMVTVLGVKGYELVPARELRNSGRPVDRDVLQIPEEVLETTEFDAATMLRPLFDSVWNAAGWEECMDYDEQGRLWHRT